MTGTRSPLHGHGVPGNLRDDEMSPEERVRASRSASTRARGSSCWVAMPATTRLSILGRELRLGSGLGIRRTKELQTRCQPFRKSQGRELAPPLRGAAGLVHEPQRRGRRYRRQRCRSRVRRDRALPRDHQRARHDDRRRLCGLSALPSDLLGRLRNQQHEPLVGDGAVGRRAADRRARERAPSRCNPGGLESGHPAT